MIKIKPSFFTFKRPSDHSRFSPSATDRWMACPYSIRASEGIPNETSVYAEAGTLAHQVCEDYANHYFFDGPMTLTLKEASDQDRHNAEGWVDVINGWINHHSIGDVLFFDLEVSLPIFPELGCFGTADALVIGTKGCAVIDYKNGTGHSVGAATPQLRTYLVSLQQYVEGLTEDYSFNAIVYQPNLDDIPREITYSLSDIENHGQQILEAIRQADDPAIQPTTGSHCYWCPAKRTKDKHKKCPAIVQQDIEVASTRFDEFFARFCQFVENETVIVLCLQLIMS